MTTAETTATLTTFEAAVLNAIAYNEMSPANTYKPKTREETGCYCWVDSFARDAKVEITEAQVKGVLSSLVKKELIVVGDWDDEDNVVDFTTAGFAVWQAVDDDRKE